MSAGPTACSSCHGFAPPLPHPQNTSCNRCHEGTVLATGAIDVAGGQHIDGTVQVSAGACTACHGTDGVNPAPPVGTRGETLTTQRAVGAHQKHVVTGTIRNAFACSDCHAPVSDLTHVNGTISLPFTGLASQGTTPSWTGTTCASTYCHGATLAAGGSTTTPTWTAVSAGPTACSSCHGAPPPFPHPPSTDCARCHSGTVLAGGGIDLAGGKHIDGTLQVDGGGCTACHGTEGVNPAPPVGTSGETLTTQRAVGAHQKHVVTGTIRSAFACSDCHAPVTDLTHVNGTISLPFTGLASQRHDPGLERRDLRVDLLPRRDARRGRLDDGADLDGRVGRADGLQLLPRRAAAAAAPAERRLQPLPRGHGPRRRARSTSPAGSTSTARSRWTAAAAPPATAPRA